MSRPIRMLVMALAVALLGAWAVYFGGWLDGVRCEPASAACTPGDGGSPGKAPRAAFDQSDLEEEDDEYRTDTHPVFAPARGAARPPLVGSPALAWSARAIERGPPELRLEPATPPPRS